MILHLTSPKRRSSLGKWHNRLDRSPLRKWGRLSRLLIIKPCDWNGGTVTTLICFHSTNAKDYCFSWDHFAKKKIQGPKNYLQTKSSQIFLCSLSLEQFFILCGQIQTLLKKCVTMPFKEPYWNIDRMWIYQLSRYLIRWVRYRQLMATISTFNLASHIGCNDFFLCNFDRFYYYQYFWLLNTKIDCDADIWE